MRSILAAVVVLVMVLALASPAFAHVRTVGGGDNWVGSPPLPAAVQGKGLIPGGPGGIYTISPSHALGLVTACHALRGNPSVQDIFGPGGPGCPHGE